MVFLSKGDLGPSKAMERSSLPSQMPFQLVMPEAAKYKLRRNFKGALASEVSFVDYDIEL